VKYVLGDFSSGVSICCNKGTQSDLGPPFCPPPWPGGTGGPSSGSASYSTVNLKSFSQLQSEESAKNLTKVERCF